MLFIDFADDLFESNVHLPKKWNLYLTWGIYIPQMMSICFARNLNDQIAIQISKWQYQRWLICDVTLATGNIHSSEESDNVMITKKSQTSRFWDFKLIIIHCTWCITHIYSVYALTPTIQCGHFNEELHRYSLLRSGQTRM